MEAMRPVLESGVGDRCGGGGAGVGVGDRCGGDGAGVGVGDRRGDEVVSPPRDAVMRWGMNDWARLGETLLQKQVVCQLFLKPIEN